MIEDGDMADVDAVTDYDETDAKVGFARLFAHYRAPLLRSFLRRGYTPDLAEDCVQDLFVRIAKTDLSRVESIEAYLFTVAASVAADHSRKMRSRQASLHEPFGTREIETAEVSPSRVLEDREALIRLDRVLDELKPRTREMFLLNRLDGLSYTEIATQYGITAAGVHKQISKALAHLRKRFVRHD